MKPELWDRVKPLFNAALERNPEDRRAFLDSLPADDDVRHELSEMVRAAEAAASAQLTVPGARPHESSLQAGDVLRHQFQIMRRLGTGGMGDVYEALDLHLAETVALKVIRPEIVERPGILARFKKEVQLAHRVTSPNICRIYAFFQPEIPGPAHQRSFFTMELLQGVTLADEIRSSGAMPWRRLHAIAQEVCAGLAAMHNAGIIHRDLKTHNIMLATRDGCTRAIVMDFGLAHELSVSPDGQDTRMTMPGVIVGTPAYMAPEQFSGSQIGPATDIYALGVVLYEMATGRQPFEIDTPLRAAISRARVLQRPSELQPSLPRRFDRIIARCLQFDPGRRYQSAEELARDLRRCSSPLLSIPSLIPARKVLVAAAALTLLFFTSFFVWKYARADRPIDARALTWYEQGVSALREGAYVKATGELQQAVNIEGPFALAHARLAEAWSELDYTGTAQREMLLALQGAQGASLSSVDRRSIDAAQSLLLQDFPAAVRHRQEILQSLPESQKGYGYLDLGRAQEKNNDILAAIQSYQASARLLPDDAAPFLHLAILQARQQNASEAEAAFNRAEQLYKVKQNYEGLGEIYFQRAHWANQRGDLDSARKWLDDCLKIASQIQSVQLEVRALTQTSNFEYFAGENDQSIAHAERAIQLARQNHLDYWITDAQIREATAYFDKRDFASADKFAFEALNGAVRDQHALLTADAQETIASIRDQQGRYDEQIQYAQEALKYFEKAGILSQALETGIVLQRGLLGKGKLDQALLSADNLLKIARRIGSPNRLTLGEETMGSALFAQQHYPESLAHFQQALQYSQAARQGTGYQFIHCADALNRLGRFNEANQALAAVPSDEAAQAAVALAKDRTAATILVTQNRFGPALAFALRAQSTYKDLSPDERMDFGTVIAQSEAALGRLKDAQLESSKLMVMASAQGSPRLLAITQLLAAQIDLRAGQPLKALDEAQQALTYFSGAIEIESAWRAQASIAQAYEAAGDRAKAASSAHLALDRLSAMQQNWDSPSVQRYDSRPDLQVTLRQLHNLIA
jgi:serine/threonine protein kinase